MRVSRLDQSDSHNDVSIKAIKHDQVLISQPRSLRLHQQKTDQLATTLLAQYLTPGVLCDGIVTGVGVGQSSDPPRTPPPLFAISLSSLNCSHTPQQHGARSHSSRLRTPTRSNSTTRLGRRVRRWFKHFASWPTTIPASLTSNTDDSPPVKHQAAGDAPVDTNSKFSNPVARRCQGIFDACRQTTAI